MAVLDEIPKGYERRMQILRAIALLSQKMSFDDMTVNDICEQAQISRTTFYRNFADKYEAINWYHRVLETDSAMNIGRVLTCHEGSLRMNQNLYKDRLLYERVYRSAEDELIQLGARMNAEAFRSTIVDFNGGTLTPMLEYEIRFWSIAVYRIAADWARHDFKEDCETLTAYMDDIRPRLLTTTLDAPVLMRRASGNESLEGFA